MSLILKTLACACAKNPKSPESPLYRSVLARSHRKLGLIHLKNKRAGQASTALQEAVLLWERPVEQYPESWGYRHDLAGVYVNLATVLRDTDRTAEAEEVYRRAIPLCQRLVDKFGSALGYARTLEKARSGFRSLLENSDALELVRGEHVIGPHVPFDRYDAFTAEAWIAGNWQGVVFEQGHAGDPENSIWMSPAENADREFAATRHQRMYGWESERGKNYHDSIGQRLSPGWNHLALVFSGTERLVFLNGRLLQQNPVPKPGPFDARRGLVIGAFEPISPDRFSTGRLRSIRVSSVARYDADFTPDEWFEPDEVTQLLYDFATSRDWLTSDQVPDLSGHGNHGTLHNAWWITQPPSSAEPNASAAKADE